MPETIPNSMRAFAKSAALLLTSALIGHVDAAESGDTSVYQCVTEMVDPDKPKGSPQLKQLWTLSLAPLSKGMRLSLVQRGSGDPAAEHYVIESRTSDRAVGKNRNGIKAELNLRNGKLTMTSDEYPIRNEGHCSRVS